MPNLDLLGHSNLGNTVLDHAIPLPPQTIRNYTMTALIIPYLYRHITAQFGATFCFTTTVKYYTVPYCTITLWCLAEAAKNVAKKTRYMTIPSHHVPSDDSLRVSSTSHSKSRPYLAIALLHFTITSLRSTFQYIDVLDPASQRLAITAH